MKGGPIQRTRRRDEERSRYWRLCNIISLAILETDTEDRCVFANPRWEEITGQTREQSAGHGWRDAIHAMDKEWALEEVQLARGQGRMSDADFRVTRADGVERWIHSQSVPLYGENDTLVGYVHTVYDLTDRKLVERQLRGSLVDVRNQQISDAGESSVAAEEVWACLNEAADISGALREASLPAEFATQIDALLKCIDSARSAAEALPKPAESVEDHSLDDILF